jgi:hypothetical protein
MGKIVPNCVCCGGAAINYSCCFYSERQDPDTLFLTTPALGWNFFTNVPATEWGDNDRLYPSYMDANFGSPQTLEMTWINRKIPAGGFGNECIEPANPIQLCNSTAAKPFPFRFGPRIYISQPIYDVANISDALQVSIDNKEPDLGQFLWGRFTYAVAFVSIEQILLPNPPFVFPATNLFYNGCLTQVYVYIFQKSVDYNSSVGAEENWILDHYENRIIPRWECQRIVLLESPACFVHYYDNTLADPTERESRICYGILPAPTSTIENYFLPIYTFKDIFQMQAGAFNCIDYDDIFCGDASEFSITW